MNRVIILLLAIGLFGCSESLDIRLEPEVNMFFSHDPKQKIRITQEDEVYAILNEWLRDNKADWHATSGRYSGGVYIESGNYGIQVAESKVVIYSIINNKPKAMYVQDIKKSELSAILNFAK